MMSFRWERDGCSQSRDTMQLLGSRHGSRTSVCSTALFSTQLCLWRRKGAQGGWVSTRIWPLPTPEAGPSMLQVPHLWVPPGHDLPSQGVCQRGVVGIQLGGCWDFPPPSDSEREIPGRFPGKPCRSREGSHPRGAPAGPGGVGRARPETPPCWDPRASACSPPVVAVTDTQAARRSYGVWLGGYFV